MHLDSSVVREMRLDRGWTQQQLADACGVSMRTVQRVEKDGIASLETTSALGSVFEVERRALLRVSTAEEGEPGSGNNLKPMLLGLAAGLLLGVLATLALTGKVNADSSPAPTQAIESMNKSIGIGDLSLLYLLPERS